ncbi:unnamed protein product [Boreogadus saida]
MIDFNDFLSMMTPKMSEKDFTEEILKAFRLFDDDCTGRISFKNLKRVAKELGENLTDEELQIRPNMLWELRRRLNRHWHHSQTEARSFGEVVANQAPGPQTPAGPLPQSSSSNSLPRLIRQWGVKLQVEKPLRTSEEGIFSFHCCQLRHPELWAGMAIKTAVAAAVSHSVMDRKLSETQYLLSSFYTIGSPQSDGSHPSLNIKLGCCEAALTCFHDNLKNVTAQHEIASGMKLFSSLKNSNLRKAVQCKDPGPAPDHSCPACDSFPRTKEELVNQLSQFLQRAASSLSINGRS